VSFTVPQGAVHALLGPNGAGKTTLLRCLTGLLRPTAGSARLLGVGAASLRPADRMRIGYVAEVQELPGLLTTDARLRVSGWERIETYPVRITAALAEP
jgi:ABC-type multidrug transport system ATPase subunit